MVGGLCQSRDIGVKSEWVAATSCVAVVPLALSHLLGLGSHDA